MPAHWPGQCSRPLRSKGIVPQHDSGGAVTVSQKPIDSSTHPGTPATPDAVAAQIAIEQAHVDKVYTELGKASERASLVEAEGLARGRISRTGDVRDEEITGLFERDALVFNANRRRATLEMQYEGLVFGRLDLDGGPSDGADREVRYVGRLGVRDDDYESLVIDWRAPAAAPVCATSSPPSSAIRMRPLEHPREGSRRSPEAPAQARRSWRCTARHTSCIPIGAGSSPVGSWSWGRPRPTRHTSSGSCPRWARNQ